MSSGKNCDGNYNNKTTMQYTPQPIYRSKEAQALAEKVRAQTAIQTLDIKLKVHLNLDRRDPQMIHEIISCIQGKRNFILYSNDKNYTIFIPRFRAAIQYKDGVEIASVMQPSDERYYEQVKLGLMTYDNFFEPAIVIDDEQATPVLQLQ